MLLSIQSGIDSVVQFMTVLIMFVFVLGIAYFTTRYIAKIQKGQMSNKNMELIDTLRISNNKCLQIVRVGERYYCMAVCKDTVTLLGEIQKEELVFYENDASAGMDFHAVLEEFKQKQKGNKK